MKIKYIIITILIIISSNLVTSTDWQAQPTNCPNSYQSQTCGGSDLVCGYSGGTTYCYDMSTLSPPAGSQTTNANSYGTYDGGFVIDCHAFDGTEPHCDNTGNLWCDKKDSCYNVGRQTTCTGGAWNTATCGTCRTDGNDFFYCDGSYTDADGCEIRVGNSCGAGTGDVDTSKTCIGTSGNCTNYITGNLDCNNDDGDSNENTCNGADGCEIDDGGACTVGGLPGTYNGCSGGTGNCVVSDVNYGTSGKEQKWSSSTETFLWITMLGLGNVFNFTDMNGANFIMNTSGIYYNGTDIMSQGGSSTEDVYVNETGDTMTGNLTIDGGNLDIDNGEYLIDLNEYFGRYSANQNIGLLFGGGTGSIVFTGNIGQHIMGVHVTNDYVWINDTLQVWDLINTTRINATDDICITGGNCLSSVSGGGTDTNASTECSGAEVLLGNTSCYNSNNFFDDTTIGNCSGDGSCSLITYDSETTNWDKDNSDDFDGAWSSLSGVPSGFSDDIDNDTTYSHLSNFTDDILWTTEFNSTGDSRWSDEGDNQTWNESYARGIFVEDGGNNYKINNNKYAFFSAVDNDVGIFFDAIGYEIELRNDVANPVLEVGIFSPYTTNINYNLDVSGNITSENWNNESKVLWVFDTTNMATDSYFKYSVRTVNSFGARALCSGSLTALTLRAGQIVSPFTVINETWRFNVRVNGSNTGLYVEQYNISSISDTRVYQTADYGTYTFKAGDWISVYGDELAGKTTYSHTVAEVEGVYNNNDCL